VLRGEYNEKCDIWSIGVMLYVMLSGKPPFAGKNDDAIIEKVKVGSYTFPEREWAKITSEAKDLISRMMEKDPTKRLSAKDALKHDWIKGMNEPKFNVELNTELVSNLKEFHAEHKLSQAAIIFMVTQLCEKQEQKRLRESFSQFDKDGNGFIELDEFIDAYKVMYPQMDAEELLKEATAIFKKADIDGSGSLDFGEWSCATINKRNLLNETNLKTAFELFDRDGGGSIDAQEVATIMGNGLKADQSVWA
jgi:calcium-dependent protein kinase